MSDRPERLRVAMLAGSLSRAGAEKQLVYMARALAEAGVTVRVLSLTRGEPYEADLTAAGLAPVWVGRYSNPAARVAACVRVLRAFRPHLVQGTHFFVNLHVALSARAVGAVSLGSIRNDLTHDLAANGRWGPWLLRAPEAFLANSAKARENAQRAGIEPARVYVVSNVIELPTSIGQVGLAGPGESRFVVAAVARLVAAKRLDRFLRALALARATDPRITGVVVGEGAERPALEALASSLGLDPGGVVFLGPRADVLDLLARAHVLMQTSDHEGFPNAVLEAMALGLPVVTTPAGDTPLVVRQGESGFVVPFDDVGGLAERLVLLARDPALSARLGAEGRRIAETQYSYTSLAPALLQVYAALAERGKHWRLGGAVSSVAGATGALA